MQGFRVHSPRKKDEQSAVDFAVQVAMGERGRVVCGEWMKSWIVWSVLLQEQKRERMESVRKLVDAIFY